MSERSATHFPRCYLCVVDPLKIYAHPPLVVLHPCRMRDVGSGVAADPCLPSETQDEQLASCLASLGP